MGGFNSFGEAFAYALRWFFEIVADTMAALTNLTNLSNVTILPLGNDLANAAAVSSHGFLTLFRAFLEAFSEGKVPAQYFFEIIADAMQRLVNLTNLSNVTLLPDGNALVNAAAISTYGFMTLLQAFFQTLASGVM